MLMLVGTLKSLQDKSNPIYGLHPLFKQAFDEIVETLNNFLESGKSDIETGARNLPGGIRFIIDSYYPKPLRVSSFENHRRYIDIQLLLGGEEWLFWARIDGINRKSLLKQDYDEKKDIEFYNSEPMSPLLNSARIVLKGIDVVENEKWANSNDVLGAIPYVILWPGDLHMPCIIPDIAQDEDKEYPMVKKIVVKVPV